ncbi:hypothetical protein KUV26_00730 [Leisingera daeponensis]|uniref:Porin n=1 Tax=Leisingera daeponensis TaxID=405746 RepID=A0ABS7N9T6_9RHOB|nr:hypothetical protein [Leisingera daeponensis]MBY6137956.1 hypothetical protein [Leisingera daeponensis]
MKRIIGAAAAAAAMAGSLQAAEITGGSFDLSTSAFADDTDFARKAVGGALELGFSRGFSTQLDLFYADFNATRLEGANATLHGIAHVSDSTSLGLFYGVEEAGNDEYDFYGIEAGHEFGFADAEFYLGEGDDGAISGTIAGIAIRKDVTSQFTINAGLDHLDLGSIDLTRIAAGAEYDIGEGAKFYGELGSLNADAQNLSGNEAFVGIGFKWDFGANRGTTFGRRGLVSKLPGL